MVEVPSTPSGETLTDLLDRIGRLRRCMQFADGLNPAQWESLRFLSRANCFSRTPSGLSTFLGTTKGTVSQTVIALESKGYVRRKSNTDDRRVTHLELTEAGCEVLARDPMMCLNEVAGRMPGEDSSMLMGTLAKLVDALEGRSGGCKQLGSCAQCGENKGQTASGGTMCAAKNAEVPADESVRLCVSFVCGGGLAPEATAPQPSPAG